jgi:hypothetical protein
VIAEKIEELFTSQPRFGEPIVSVSADNDSGNLTICQPFSSDECCRGDDGNLRYAHIKDGSNGFRIKISYFGRATKFRCTNERNRISDCNPALSIRIPEKEEPLCSASLIRLAS